MRYWLDRAVKDGDVTLTERGKPIARIVAMNSSSTIDRLIAEGVIIPAQRPRSPSRSFRKVKAHGSVSDLLAEQRR